MELALFSSGVTKKPESVRKTQLGGRPKREMLKQLPVLESEGAGKITRKKPVAIDV